MSLIGDMRFAPLVPALRRQVADDGGGGAGLAVVLDGTVVVDLVEGYADAAHRRRFGADTLTPLFSTGKVMIGVMMARLIGDGRLRLEQHVAEHWPEFAQGGKQYITVGQLLGHRAGLAALPDLADPKTWFDPAEIAARLAAMAPLWEPGSASGYHAITFGALAGELYRRITGNRLGADFRALVAEPRGLDLWLGLPPGEQHRVAETDAADAVTDFGTITELRRQVFLSPGSSPGGRSAEEWRAADLPAVNGHGTARDLARLMGALAHDGVLDGVAIVSLEAIAAVSAETGAGEDLVLPHRLSWGAGFIRNAGFGGYGPSPDAFGHSGWGGSCAFADPANRLALAYVPTHHSGALIADARARRLVDLAYSCL